MIQEFVAWFYKGNAGELPPLHSSETIAGNVDDFSREQMLALRKDSLYHYAIRPNGDLICDKQNAYYITARIQMIRNYKG